MTLQSQTTGDKSRFVVCNTIHSRVASDGGWWCWCLRCVVFLCDVLSNHTSHDKVQKIEIGREKAFSEVQSTLPFVQGND